MTSIDGQAALVTASLTRDRGHAGRHDNLPRHWPRRTYTLEGYASGRAGATPPPVGECITTLPGAYWRVVSVLADGAALVLTLEELRPTSLEAHGPVRPLYGGVLT